MFALNLKSLIYHDSFRLSKNVRCTVFRSSLVEAPKKNNCIKRYSSIVAGNGNRKQLLHPASFNNVMLRHVATKKLTSSPIKWKTVLVVGSIALGFIIFFRYLKNKKLDILEKERNKQLGKAKLGGRFELVDQNNKQVKSEDLFGEWLLIYFGFTHCPDICPEELEKMVEVVDKIDKSDDLKKVVPIFITVDPERDSPSVIKKYLNEFSEKIIGLTGTVDQIAAVCKAYRVYFSPGPKDSDADYIVDHSIIMYLVDPQGNFMDYYGQNKNAEAIVDSISFNQAKQDLHKKSLFKKISEFLKNQ